MDPVSYLVMLPVPYICVVRAYGWLLGVSLQYGGGSWASWNMRLCVTAFSWELCVGVRLRKLL